MAFLGLRAAIDQWAAYGIFDVLLPLLLIFVIVFSILQRAKILGGRKPIDAVVAFIISLFVVINPVATSLFAPIFSNAGLALVVMIAVMLLVGVLFEVHQIPESLKWIFVVGGIAVFIWALSTLDSFYPIAVWFPVSSYWWDANSIWIICGLIVVLVVGMVIFSSGKANTPAKPVAAGA